MRLGFVYVPNGIIMEHWTPVGDGDGFQIRPHHEGAGALPRPHDGAERTGAGERPGAGRRPGDHARAGATWLTGVHPKKTEGADIHAGVSADQIAARELGKSTQLGSLEIGLESPTLAGDCDSGYSCAYTNTISWRSPTTPKPMEISPARRLRAALRRWRQHRPRRPPGQPERSSAAFWITSAGDVDRLETGWAHRDRGKLNEYLDAIRDIERRIQKAEEQNATVKIPVMERPTSMPEEFDEHARLMMDLMVIAYQTDMTRVVSCMIAREGSNRSYRSIGVPDGHHSVTHHDGDPVKIEKVAKINHLHAQTFAYLLQKMRPRRMATVRCWTIP